MKHIMKLSILGVLLFVFACNAQDQKAAPSKKSEEKVISLPQPGNIDLNEMKALMDSKEILLLDVRTPEEYEQGAIPNAKLININSADFKQKVAEINKEQPVIVYCRSGARSSRAMGMMNDMGFKEVYNLEGGYLNYSSNRK
jgi:rhodanese-related sulfurtransferase